MAPSDVPSETPCSYCAEPISRSAKKCRHCDAFQGRWSFFNLSVPVLGLLVALVSVLSFSIPILQGAFHTPESDVRVSFQYFESGVAYVVASNAGQEPGSIGEVYLDDGTASERYYLRAEPATRYVAAGASRQLAFTLPCGSEINQQFQYGLKAGRGPNSLATGVQLNVVIIQFDGTSRTESFELGALSGLRAINDRLYECVQARLRDASEGP